MIGIESLIAQIEVPGWWFMAPIYAFAVGMLVWDAVEVGRNDGANLVNAVYGARLMTRRRAVFIAGLAVIIGATMGEGVIETARKGIFKPSYLQPYEAVAIYVSVYLVDTVLLYGYSAFGMPVSTTACLVFELLGASLMMSVIRGYDGVVQWDKAGNVILAIIFSIPLAGVSAYLIQRIVRGAIGRDTTDLRTMRLHAPWVGGGMATGLFFFLMLKGMSKVPIIAHLHGWIDSLDDWLRSSVATGDASAGVAGASANQFISYGMTLSLVAIWVVFGAVILGLISTYRERAAARVFPVLAIIGMIAMAIAFGQNDLANCASPGLATVNVLRKWDLGTLAATKTPIWRPLLFGCGVLLFLGMRTKNATRVTKAAVQMGSHTDRVSLYAPKWCIAISQMLVGRRGRDVSLAPEPRRTEKGKKVHYDSIRATTIMGVSASVIALASSNSLPVSTTYVTMAAVIGSGMGDRIFERGDAALKLARAIWVGISWFMAAFFAAVFTALVCVVVYYTELFGLVGVLVANLLLRRYFKRRGDVQTRRAREEMQERAYPERFALEEDL